VREVEVRVSCDHCVERDPELRIPSVRTEIIRIGGLIRQLDLCQEGIDALEPLRRLLERRGAPVERETSKSSLGDTNWFCIKCGTEFTTSSGLTYHYKVVHGVRYSQTLGDTCPLCGRKGKGPGQHCSQVHGLTIPKALQLAREEGDPYGIVAHVMAALS